MWCGTAGGGSSGLVALSHPSPTLSLSLLFLFNDFWAPSWWRLRTALFRWKATRCLWKATKELVSCLALQVARPPFPTTWSTTTQPTIMSSTVTLTFNSLFFAVLPRLHWGRAVDKGHCGLSCWSAPLWGWQPAGSWSVCTPWWRTTPPTSLSCQAWFHQTCVSFLTHNYPTVENFEVVEARVACRVLGFWHEWQRWLSLSGSLHRWETGWALEQWHSRWHRRSSAGLARRGRHYLAIENGWQIFLLQFSSIRRFCLICVIFNGEEMVKVGRGVECENALLKPDVLSRQHQIIFITFWVVVVIHRGIWNRIFALMHPLQLP